MALDLMMRLDPTGRALVPADELQAQTLEELQQVGGVFKVKVTQARVSGFHRKGMALFRYLFNLWEPAAEEVDGVPVAKDFESFRENLTIKAGFYRQVFDIGGGFELKAMSLKWSAMDNITFSQVYSRVIDVGLDVIGKAGFLSPDEVNAAVDRLMGFA